MLARRVIPCLDVAGGRVVKGTRFVNLRDAGDPVELAVLYDREGADEVVFLDITASHEGRDIMEEVVRATAEALTIPFTVGGGLRTVDDLRRMLRAGADKVAINTAAVQRPDLIREAAERFGSQCIVGGVPVPVVASGGAGVLQHFVDAVTVAGADAVLAASVFHYRKFSIAEVKAYMAACGVPVRRVEPVGGEEPGDGGTRHGRV